MADYTEGFPDFRRSVGSIFWSPFSTSGIWSFHVHKLTGFQSFPSGGNRGFCRRSGPWYRVRDLHYHLFSPFLLCVFFYPHISSIFSLFYYVEVQKVFTLVYTKRTSHPQISSSVVDLTSTSYAIDMQFTRQYFNILILAVEICCFLFYVSDNHAEQGQF